MGDTEGWEDNGRGSRNLEGKTGEGGCGNNAIDRSSEGMGNTKSGTRFSETSGPAGHSPQPDESAEQRETEPSLGGNAHGASSRMDYAELFTACDNRTDELRLLGNGVVPATAERAFKVLMEELL